MTDALIASIAAVLVAGLAWDGFRRYLAHRSALLLERSRLDKFETDLAEHKATHEKAIKSLVTQMREELDPLKTRVSTALDNRQPKARFPR